MEELKNQKSNKYFAIIPYWIIDNLSINHIGLYTKIKRSTGEKPEGECYLSEKTMMKSLKIGKKALKKSITFLKNNNLIYEIGKKEILTSGGPQKVMFYKITNISDFNNKHYEGLPKRTPLYNKGVFERAQRGTLLRYKEDLIIKEERIISSEEQERINKTKNEIRGNMKTIKGG